MAELKASPRNSALGAISDALRKARDFGDRARIPLIDLGLGELLLGKTPEEINEWAYGNAPLQVVGRGTGSRVPQLKRGRAEQLADTIFAAPMARPLVRVARAVPRALEHGAREFAHASAAANPAVVKGRGGNWNPQLDPRTALRSEMRAENMSPEDAAKLGVDPESYERAKAIDTWIQGPLAKYMMRDMATEGDPIRRLADEGILHVKPDELNFNMDAYGRWPLEGQTFLAKSDTAKAWEGASDNAIGITPRWQLAPEPGSTKFSRENPWVDKLPEDAPIFSLVEPHTMPDSLGLDQLIQSTYDDLLEGSLRLEQLKSGSFGVEAAVRRAHNKRVAQEAAQEAEVLKNLISEATVEHKAYPEGYRWMELKAPDPEAWEEAHRHLPPAEWDNQVAEFRRNRYNQLRKALNAEGDYMGHCVGDYCDSVLEGGTRIFSLRDPQGKPLVTVEARKSGEVHDFEDQAYQWVARHRPELDIESDEYMEAVMDKMIEFSHAPRPDWTIHQIKGSGKKDPTQAITQEDLQRVQPYIQDFLNTQEWSKVKDLPNAKLRDMRDLYGDRLPEGSKRFMTFEEQQEFNKLYPNLESDLSRQLNEGDWEVEFAEGGLVRGPDFFENLEAFLRG